MPWLDPTLSDSHVASQSITRGVSSTNPALFIAAGTPIDGTPLGPSQFDPVLHKYPSFGVYHAPERLSTETASPTAATSAILFNFINCTPFG